MLPFLTQDYGNPSSSHAAGRRAASGVEAARAELRDLIGARYDSEVIFTSGATESDHLAITGIAASLGHQGNHIVTTATEHKAVLEACDALARKGYQVTRLPVDRDGLVDPADVAAALTS